MEQEGYLPRVVDRLVDDILGYSGGVLIEGVRACGKTVTGRRHASSEIALDSGLPQLRAALDVDPSLLLAGDVPRLLDEWQIEPSLWNLVRREIDSRRHPGQFILTGSSVPAEDAARHSGALRSTPDLTDPNAAHDPVRARSRGWQRLLGGLVQRRGAGAGA